MPTQAGQQWVQPGWSRGDSRLWEGNRVLEGRGHVALRPPDRPALGGLGSSWQALLTDDASLGASTGFGRKWRVVYSVQGLQSGVHALQRAWKMIYGVEERKELSLLFGLMVYFKSET